MFCCFSAGVNLYLLLFVLLPFLFFCDKFDPVSFWGHVFPLRCTDWSFLLFLPGYRGLHRECWLLRAAAFFWGVFSFYFSPFGASSLSARFGASSLTVVFDEISMVEGFASFSRSNANSGLASFPLFVGFPLFFASASASLDVDDSSMTARFPILLSFSFCCLDACTTSLFEKTFGVFDGPSSTVIVWGVSVIFPDVLAKAGSSFDP